MHTKIKLIFPALFLLIIFQAHAQNCFIYPDSSSYCTALTQGEAETECSFYGDCTLQKYLLTVSCSEQEECKTVMCKNSCTEEYLGKCSGGEIPTEEESKWCTSGCCQFSYYGQTFCEFTSNKWRCENEARNKDVIQYLFVYPLDEQSCMEKCSSNSLGNLPSETVSEKPPSVAQGSSKIISSTKKEPEIAETATPEEESTESNSLFIWFVVILVLALGGYLVYRWRASFSTPPTFKPVPQTVLPKEKKSPWWMNFRSVNPLTQRKLSKLKAYRLHKQKEMGHKFFFAEFGAAVKPPTVGQPKPDAFIKLEKITKRYQPPAEHHHLEELNQLVEEKKKKATEKEEMRQTLIKLRKMAKK